MTSQSPCAENAVLKAVADKSAANMIRSHSIPGDLHCVHAPDPVAADILRKEPEQETYVKLNVNPIGTSCPSPNYVSAYPLRAIWIWFFCLKTLKFFFLTFSLQHKSKMSHLVKTIHVRSSLEKN